MTMDDRALRLAPVHDDRRAAKPSRYAIWTPGYLIWPSERARGGSTLVNLRSTVHQANANVELIERESQLAQLGRHAALCEAGSGQVVLLSGEAGIGKSSLLRAFTEALPGARDVWWGYCDPLETPNPLGPLRDMASRGGTLASLLDRGLPPNALFGELLRTIQAASAPVIVFDDAHWADQSTLDLLIYVGRRIDRTHAMLVLSFRDEELALSHPLRPMIGELPAAHTVRIELPRLSERAVTTLAQRALRSPAGIHAVTGGNPFFVTEILRHGVAEPTRSVEQLVLGRMARLQPGARKVVQLASIVPGKAERWLVEQIVAPAVEDLDAALDSSLVELDHAAFRFRHEIARVAVERSLSPIMAEDLHRLVLRALEPRHDQAHVLPLLVHHAVHARDKAAVLRYAPRAAQIARECGARREAAAHLHTALEFGNGIDTEERLRFLEAYAVECRAIDRLAQAIAAREERARLLESAGDPVQLAVNFSELALDYVVGLRNADADAASRKAISILESAGEDKPLAHAYAVESHLRMLNRDIGGAITRGRCALQLANAHGMHEVIATAHGTVGCALMFVDYEAGRRELQVGERTAAQHQLHAIHSRIQANRGAIAAELFDLVTAERDLQLAIETATLRQNDLYRSYSLAWLAFVDLVRGRWEDARDHAHEVLECSGTNATPPRVIALCVAGRLAARQGQGQAGELLDQALELALGAASMQRIVPVRAARAEAALLRGDVAAAIAEAAPALEMAVRMGQPWYVGDLSLSLSRADDRAAPVERCAMPHVLEITGRWQEAAHEWQRLSCPYEQARALSAGDGQGPLEALSILESLGAVPAAESVRRSLRAEGVRGVPRGPRLSTQRNPLGLTNRELEIARLLCEGMRNSEIADRLYRSVRTIENHVDSILDKLRVGSRGEVPDVLRAEGLLEDPQRAGSARTRRVFP